MRGGNRPGAGRKKGSVTTKTRDIAVRAAAEGLTPLEFMLNLMRQLPPEDAETPQRIAFDALRFEAAKAAAPYVHPRLAAIEHTGKDGGPIETTVTDSDLQRWLAFEATRSVIKKAKEHEPA